MFTATEFRVSASAFSSVFLLFCCMSLATTFIFELFQLNLNVILLHFDSAYQSRLFSI